jgi:hypothetical protein
MPGGLPPDLMAMAQQGAPPAPGPSPLHGGAGQGDADSALRDAIDSLTLAAQAATDEQDAKVILTCITQLQGILAANQQQQDQMLQGKATPAAVRKASGG